MKSKYNKVNAFIFRMLVGSRSYYSRDYYYENLLDRYGDGQLYWKLINNLKNLIGKKTNIEINVFDDKNLDDTAIKDVVKKYGKANYKMKYPDLFDIQVFFYRRQIGGFKTKMEFHFYKKNLFFFSYNFPYLRAENRKEIIQIIEKKYLGEELQDIFDNYIIDNNKNVIFLNNNSGLSIYYFCSDNIAFDKILKYVNNQKANRKLKSEINHKVLYKRL